MKVEGEALAREVAAILNCSHCTERAQDGLPQPPWIGSAHEPDGIVLLARNPSSARDLDEDERQLLQRLAEHPSADLLREWSQHRINHMVRSRGGSGYGVSSGLSDTVSAPSEPPG